jgi:hypothetical protein
MSNPFAGMSQATLLAARTAFQEALIELASGKAVVSVSYTQGDGAKSMGRRVTNVGEVNAMIALINQVLTGRSGRRFMGVRYR